MNVSHLPGGTLARSVSDIQGRIAQARSEMVTGRIAEPVAQLGAGRGRMLAVEAQADRLDGIRSGNTLVSDEPLAVNVRRAFRLSVAAMMLSASEGGPARTAAMS